MCPNASGGKPPIGERESAALFPLRPFLRVPLQLLLPPSQQPLDGFDQQVDENNLRQMAQQGRADKPQIFDDEIRSGAGDFAAGFTQSPPRPRRQSENKTAGNDGPRPQFSPFAAKIVRRNNYGAERSGKRQPIKAAPLFDDMQRVFQKSRRSGVEFAVERLAVKARRINAQAGLHQSSRR